VRLFKKCHSALIEVGKNEESLKITIYLTLCAF